MVVKLYDDNKLPITAVNLSPLFFFAFSKQPTAYYVITKR